MISKDKSIMPVYDMKAKQWCLPLSHYNGVLNLKICQNFPGTFCVCVCVCVCWGGGGAGAFRTTLLFVLTVTGVLEKVLC